MELPGDITDLLLVDNDNDGSENTFDNFSSNIKSNV